MSMQANRESVFEATLRQAVIDDLMHEVASVPSNDELSKIYTFSHRHTIRMNRLFAKEKRQEYWKAIFKYSKRVAVVAMIIVTILFSTLMLNPKVRAAVVDVIIEWFEGFTSFHSPETDSQKVFDPTWRPEYIPEDFTEGEIFQAAGAMELSYKTDSGRTLSFSYISNDGKVFADNDDMAYKIEEHNGIEYHIFESTDSTDNIIIWDNAGYRFSISANIPIQEIKKMAFSTKKNNYKIMAVFFLSSPLYR